MFSSLKDFYGQLSSSNQDSLVQLIQDMQGDYKESRLKELGAELEIVSERIETTNAERQRLTEDRRQIKTVLDKLKKYLKLNHDADVVIRQFSMLLLYWMTDLKSKILALKPEADLQRKHEISLECDLIKHRMEIASGLQELLFGEGNDGRSKPKPTSTDEGASSSRPRVAVPLPD